MMVAAFLPLVLAALLIGFGLLGGAMLRPASRPKVVAWVLAPLGIAMTVAMVVLAVMQAVQDHRWWTVVVTAGVALYFARSMWRLFRAPVQPNAPEGVQHPSQLGDEVSP